MTCSKLRLLPASFALALCLGKTRRNRRTSISFNAQGPENRDSQDFGRERGRHG
jgi:hypothetical protein